MLLVHMHLALLPLSAKAATGWYWSLSTFTVLEMVKSDSTVPVLQPYH